MTFKCTFPFEIYRMMHHIIYIKNKFVFNQYLMFHLSLFNWRTPSYPWRRVTICKENFQLPLIKKLLHTPFSIEIKTRNIWVFFTWPKWQTAFRLTSRLKFGMVEQIIKVLLQPKINTQRLCLYVWIIQEFTLICKPAHQVACITH